VRPQRERRTRQPVRAGRGRHQAGSGSGAQRREHLVDRRVVGGVLVDMLVANATTRAEDKCRAELVGALARLRQPVARPVRTPRASEAARVEEQPERVDPAKGCRGRRVRVVVDENGERNPLLLDEVGGVAAVSRPNCHDLGAEAPDLVVVLTQLRGVLPAEQSAEVPEKDQHDGPILPVPTQPMGDTGRIIQLDGSESLKIHGPSLAPAAHRVRRCDTEDMTANFTRMDESTAEQWSVIGKETMAHQGRVADSVLAMLQSLAEVTDGFAVDQLTHCLQTATLAERAGADDEVVIASLCHDIGKAVSVPNHPKIAAAILQPYVRDDVYQMILVHQDFQGRHYYHHFGGDPNARDEYREEPWFDLAEQFADEWDQIAFDPDYDTLPLEHFEPRVRSTFASVRLGLVAAS